MILQRKYSLLATTLYALALCSIIACGKKVQPATAADKTITADSLVAAIERTACFGFCPEYKISLYQSGYAVYEGKRNVQRTGIYYSHISQKQISELIAFAELHDYFKLNDEYRNKYLTDFPTVYSEIRSGKQSKRVTHYTDSPPANLVLVEEYLDRFFEKQSWQPLPDQSGE